MPWFQMLQKSGTITSWHTLAQAIELAYGPSIFECPQYALFKLSQIGFVVNYNAHFNALANSVEGMSTTALLNCFISGLQRELQRGMLPWHPDSLSKAVALAELYEDRHVFSPGPGLSNVQSTPSIRPPHLPAPTVIASPLQAAHTPPMLPAPMATTSSSRGPAYKRISLEEMQLRRAKGLCFN